MTYIWQSPDWPQLDYDPIAVEPLLLEFTDLLGEGRGLWSALGSDDQASFLGDFAVDAVDFTAFEDWAGQGGYALPVKAALAFLWFAAGHARSETGSHLAIPAVVRLFAQAGAPFDPAPWLLAEQAATREALESGWVQGAGHIDATGFVQHFLRVLGAGVAQSAARARHLVQRNRFFLNFADALSKRQALAVTALFAAEPETLSAGISAGQYGALAEVSSATATRDLAAMTAVGALLRSEEGGRSTRYYLNLG